MVTFIARVDAVVIGFMAKRGMFLLRLALAAVFLWFGALKIFDESPVRLFVAEAAPLFEDPAAFMALGAWEMLIGFGLLSKRALRLTFFLLWLEMLGIGIVVLASPHFFFFSAQPWRLTFEGEFVVKNIVLIAASLAIAGHVLGNKRK